MMISRKQYLTLLVPVVFVLASSLSKDLMALEVDKEVLPQISWSGRVITTVEGYDQVTLDQADAEYNLDDTEMSLDLSKSMLGKKGYAGARIGIKNEHGVQFHQLETYIRNEKYHFNMGKGDLDNNIVEFPTLREDDLLTYTHVGNASSTDHLDQLYGERVRFGRYFSGKRSNLDIWGASRKENADHEDGDGHEPHEQASYGLNYIYQNSEALLYERKLRRAGIGIDHQEVKGSEKNSTAIMAGAQFNLNDNPTKNWQGTFQVIAIDGALESSTLLNASEQTQVDSVSLATSLLYTARPQLQYVWQAGLILAYKDYRDSDDASQWSVAPSYQRGLAQGINFVSQVVFTQFSDAMFDGETDQRLVMGLTLDLDHTFNRHIPERDSIMNLEQGYL